MKAETGQDRDELILYLTPGGPLGASCQAYFERVRAEVGATVAQSYPPHVTLTGFFRRKPVRLTGLVAEIAAVVGAGGEVPGGAVEVVGFGDHDEWVGLQVRSPWAKERVAEIIEQHRLDPGDDALRPKDWLHLSLAYGGELKHAPLARYAELAKEMIDPADPVVWRFLLWQRLADGSWRNHP